jgi:hypothetical protein
MKHPYFADENQLETEINDSLILGDIMNYFDLN